MYRRFGHFEQALRALLFIDNVYVSRGLFSEKNIFLAGLEFYAAASAIIARGMMRACRQTECFDSVGSHVSPGWMKRRAREELRSSMMILGPGLALEWDTCDGFVKITVVESLEEGRGGFKLGRDTRVARMRITTTPIYKFQKNDRGGCL